MEILPVSPSSSIAYGESSAFTLEDPTLRAGNPVKEILLNLIYLITGIVIDDGGVTSFQQSRIHNRMLILNT
ncbi:hypothetical protein Tco_1571092 [Tanacetum coccineum]